MRENKNMTELHPTLSDSQKIAVNQVQLNTKLNDVESTVNHLEKVVLLGNGEIAIREQVRKNTEFINNVRYWLRFTGGILISWVLAQVIVLIVAANWVTNSLMPILTKLANQP